MCEIRLNLACAELYLENRRRSIQSIDDLMKLKLSMKDKQLVQSFWSVVGERQQNKKGSPKRDNIVNRSMGKMLRKGRSVSSEKIETFINTNVKQRYEKRLADTFNKRKIPASHSLNTANISMTVPRA